MKIKTEEMEIEIEEVDGYNKACKNCGSFFIAKRKNAKYCDSKCRNQHYAKKKRRKAFWRKFWSALGLKRKSEINNEGEELNKVDYARLTFILSVIGFMGSIGFYIGVLREVYSPVKDQQKIEMLQEENQALKNTLFVLIEKYGEDGESGE